MKAPTTSVQVFNHLVDALSYPSRPVWFHVTLQSSTCKAFLWYKLTQTENSYTEWGALAVLFVFGLVFPALIKILPERNSIYLDTNCCFSLPFIFIRIACSHATHSILDKNNWRTHTFVTSFLTMHAGIFLNPQACPFFPSTLIAKTCNFPCNKILQGSYMLQLIYLLNKRPVWI